jgi:hypothetical protein
MKIIIINIRQVWEVAALLHLVSSLELLATLGWFSSAAVLLQDVTTMMKSNGHMQPVGK